METCRSKYARKHILYIKTEYVVTIRTHERDRSKIDFYELNKETQTNGTRTYVLLYVQTHVNLLFIFL